jgi:thioredoxin-like negative regulator of GroEL
MTEKEEKNKGGRPALGSAKRDRVISAYYDPGEYEAVSRKAEAAGMARSEYVRTVSLKGYVRAIDTPEAQDEKRKLIGLSNNINQLARLAHQQGMKQVVSRLDAVLDEMDGILKKYKR